MKRTKQNLNEFDLDNEITEFLRFVVIESLEETSWVKLSLSLI